MAQITGVDYGRDKRGRTVLKILGHGLFPTYLALLSDDALAISGQNANPSLSPLGYVSLTLAPNQHLRNGSRLQLWVWDYNANDTIVVEHVFRFKVRPGIQTSRIRGRR